MNSKLLQGIRLATVALMVMCLPCTGARAEKRLTWVSSGTLAAITADSITVEGFTYKLTPATAYERGDQHSTLSAFEVGDYVKIRYLTDRTVLELEAKESSSPIVTDTPPPAATPQALRLSARLSPLGSSAARGQGSATYQSSEGRFALEIDIPKNTVPLATTAAQAKALSVTASITRKGAAVATCGASFASKRGKLSVYKFEIEVERSTRYGATRTRSKRGSCVLANGSTGLPIVKAGDSVTVSEVTAGDFLSGKF